jgi:hypothetical protein
MLAATEPAGRHYAEPTGLWYTVIWPDGATSEHSDQDSALAAAEPGCVIKARVLRG